MPSFDTMVGEGGPSVSVIYECDEEGYIEIEAAWFAGVDITPTLTQATITRLETEAEADYKKLCEDRNADSAISRYESRMEAV